MKDHEIAALVNDLTAIAKQFSQTQQLRERISQRVVSALTSPIDPMDTPLPCDVTVGHGTMYKGVALRSLVNRTKVLYKMATGYDADEVAGRSVEDRAKLADGLKFKADIESAERFDGVYSSDHR